MFRKNFAPVWIGIILLSGMLLMAPDCAAQICDADPCQSIPNAIVGTCTEIDGSCSAASDYICSCYSRYSWQPATHTCEGTTLPTYIPDKPEGMAAGLIITGVTDLVTHYLIECEDSLQYFGFDNTITSEKAYAASTFATNYIYYNAHPGDDYCYVTASNLNTENTITAMWWNTITLSWNIKIPVPLVATLTSYGYTVAQAIPVVGQKFSINMWAELTYEEGGGIWGGGLGSTLHMRWFAPNLNSTVQGLSHFSFNIRNGDTGTTAKEHYVGVDNNLADNGYYTADVENLPPANSLSLSAVLWSNSGDQSQALGVGTVYVVVEVLDSPPV